ncbi:MAG TPA: cyclopropane-fatty-acyl-phospholipid synthase family protein [Candidatus Acidoferrum sp.]|nr:cyclopropane-fatty-acyl-phospholipid synthase family protein [Candidatus Acidoferrum sp.]
MLFAVVLKSIIRSGHLRLIDGAGRTHDLGDRTPPRCTIRVASRRLDYTLAFNPALSVGEAYMDGELTVEEGTLYDFLEIAARNYVHLQRSAWYVLVNTVARRLKQYNPVGRARRNVAHHYDLSDQLYDLFLDRDRQYSCAYFAAESDSLETAQENKKRHIASKLMLDRQRLRVLDIGSGWGGLGLYLAQEAGADVTGVTLSVEQHKVSQARAADAGLAERVRFHLRDYREEQGRYDRIVSVGMFEHVGVPHYREFFQKLKDLLADDGVALLHSIGSMGPPGGTNPWLQKYIFPGGYTPALSEVMEAVQAAGLWVTDIEILRLHYAETLRAWRQRFAANRERVRALYDERFCRMWDFYLTGCELSFRYGDQMVFQMQLAKQQLAVPLTRDYMVDWERAHLAGGRARLRAVR